MRVAHVVSRQGEKKGLGGPETKYTKSVLCHVTLGIRAHVHKVGISNYLTSRL
jgi:hypothetical protein